MTCQCGYADECDGEHATFYPLQDGGMCSVRPCPMTTFDELFAEHNLTPEERKALVMHLATLRAQKTVAALQDCPHAAPHRYCDTCPVKPCPIGLGA